MEPREIQRWDFIEYTCTDRLEEDSQGSWVLYEDHERAITILEDQVAFLRTLLEIERSIHAYRRVPLA